MHVLFTDNSVLVDVRKLRVKCALSSYFTEMASAGKWDEYGEHICFKAVQLRRFRTHY